MDRKKPVTLTFEDFKEISTDAAAECCARIGANEALVAFSAMLTARIAVKIFGNEKLTIEPKEET